MKKAINKKKPQALAIFGGTFDPVHLGHLACAKAIADLNKDISVLLVPDRQPPHRAEPTATPEDRLAMLKLAVADLPRIHIDCRELQRPGPSYSCDTLKSFRKEYGAAMPLLFVMGLDAYKTLPEWHDWQTLTDLAHLLVLARPGEDVNLSTALSDWQEPKLASEITGLLKTPAGQICHQRLAEVPVSATQARQAYRTGTDATGLTSPEVDTYIRQQGLYLG
ncbi:MAG: nicotinate-nucleotide adenylyltransferase [Pseudomonadales bacterium]